MKTSRQVILYNCIPYTYPVFFYEKDQAKVNRSIKRQLRKLAESNKNQ